MPLPYFLTRLAESRRAAPAPASPNELAMLAGKGDAAGLAAAMTAHPEADPGMAVAWAAANGHLDCMRLAMARFDAGSFHPLAAALAAQHGKAECLAELMEQGADAAQLADTLRSACSSGQAECVAALLALASPPDPDAQLLPTADPGGLGSRSALNWARIAESDACETLLISAIAERDPRRGLVLAARHGKASLVAGLAHHADPHASEALYEAAANGHADCVAALLPVSDPKWQESCALRFAVQKGSTECVALVLPLSDPTECGYQALSWACLWGHADCAAMLLDAAAPPKPVADSCLSTAIVGRDAQSVQVVASRCGANFSEINIASPLHLALDLHMGPGYDDDDYEDDEPAGYVLDIAWTLLAHGCQMRPNKQGEDPYDYAIRRGFPLLATTLRGLAARAEALAIGEATVAPAGGSRSRPPRV